MSGKSAASKRLVKIVGLALSVFLLAGDANLATALAADSGVLTGDVRVTVNPANIKDSLPIPGGSRKVTMALHDVDLQDALRALAQKGGFNVLIDESVVGNISVDLNNVTIQDALETLKSYGNLVYQVQGKNLMVAEATSEKGKAFKKTSTRVFRLHNANAKVVANFLNTTVFADRTNASGASSAGGSSGSTSGGGTSGGTANLPVTPDFNTNSLIVVGDPMDLKVVEEHIAALDRPRQSKTWRLSQANVLDVASALSASLFNEGQPALTMTSGSSSSSGSTGSTGNSPASLRVVAEKISDGTGGSQSSQATGSSGGNQTPVVNSLTLRTRVQETQTIQVSPMGPIILPDTRLNTLTLMGTAEQIAMAEPMIALLDRKVPQLVLEAALIEVSEDGVNQLGFSMGSSSGHFSTGSNNTGGAFTNALGRLGQAGENILRYSTNPSTMQRGFYYQILAMIHKNKAKILANPTIITSSDNEAAISIVDEIIRSVSVTQGSFGGATAKTYNIGEAGIVLNILPKVGANNTVSMRVRPIVTSVVDTKRDLNQNIVTLLSKREALAQNVQVKDGETFIMGGLLHNTNSQAVTSNPLLANLPIVGALGRNNSATKHRTELVIMITPHIINDEAQLSRTVPMFSSPGGSGMQSANFTGAAAGSQTLGGMVPVSFSGAAEKNANALPPLMQAKPFNSLTNGVDPLAGKSMVTPSPRPSGSLLPDDMVTAPTVVTTGKNSKPVIKTTAASPVKAEPQQEPQKESVMPRGAGNFMSDVSVTTTGSATSRADDSAALDDKVRAIMEKYK